MIIYKPIVFSLYYIMYFCINAKEIMETLIINVDSRSNAKFLKAFLETIPYIKSIVTEKATKIDWTKPSNKPATDEEIELMLIESEKGRAISSESSKKQNLKNFKVIKQKIN